MDFVSMIEEIIEYKFLVLYRNPVSAAYSVIRRELTKNAILQAKIVEDNLIYIEKQLRQLQRDCYRTLIFEDFISNPYAFVKGLSEWWDIDMEILYKGMKNIKMPTQLSEIPKKEKKILEDFFTERRIRQWIDFYSSNSVLSEDTRQ